MQINYINSLRVLATFAVVFLHTGAGLLDTRDIACPGDRFWLSCYKYCMQFSVPLFVMISGALFLNPTKETGFGLMLCKYVKRIVLALLIFGLPMCFIETYFSNSEGVINSIIHFVKGQSWAHMWYLYMLIGLYLITPVIKPFATKATDKEWIASLTLLFVLSSLFPTLNRWDVGLTSYMVISSPYIFIYLLGYWLCYKAPQKLVDNKPLLIIVTLLCIGIIIVKCHYGLDVSLYGYADPVVICLAATLFLLFRTFNINCKLANRLAPYCFGIYLIHPVFINFAYKFIKIETDMIVPIYSFVGFFLLFSVLSLAGSCMMMRIPFLRKHVL